MSGIFCEVYGKSLHNRVLEFLLENQGLDFAIGDLAKEIKISRPSAYGIIEELAAKEIVKKSRIVGKTQLYVINRANGRVQLLQKAFKDCLKLLLMEKCIHNKLASQ